MQIEGIKDKFLYRTKSDGPLNFLVWMGTVVHSVRLVSRSFQYRRQKESTKHPEQKAQPHICMYKVIRNATGI